MKTYTFENDFAIGADISWYPEMVKSGFAFLNKDGKEQDILLTFNEYGMNSIRLRTWVNPSDHLLSGHCSAAETLALALQCKEKGYRIMINFHYSDSWCDPGKQRKPSAWAALTFDSLVNAVYDYTYETMQLFVNNGLTPEWVQIGNETNPGMLLPDGSTDNFEKLTKLYNAGHDAVKVVSKQTKTVIHLAEFNYTEFICHYFDELNHFGCRYDMMGFSFYPYHLPSLSYQKCFDGFERSLKEIPERFNKDFMIVEIGGVDDEEAESYQLLIDTIEKINTQPKCKGIFLWEPEGAKVWSGYPLSSWRADGCPTKAMDALLACRLK